MFSFLRKNPKELLQAKIDRAREKHEKDLQREDQESLEKAYRHLQEQIITFSRLGKFQDTEQLFHEYASAYPEKKIQKLHKLAKKEELHYLTKNFLECCKAGEKEKAASLLSDIHVRTSAEKYQWYEQILEHPEYIGTWKEHMLHVKIWAAGLQKLRPNVSFSQSVAIPFTSPSKTSPPVDHFQQTDLLLEKEEGSIFNATMNLPEENVNEFESIFGDVPQNEKDILDSILEQGEVKGEPKKAVETQFKLSAEEEPEEIAYINPFLPYLPHIQKVATFSVLALLFSWMFFFIQLDDQNRILAYLNQNNIYSQHAQAEEQMTRLQKSIQVADIRLQKLKEGILDIPGKIALQEIQLRKIDWMKLRNDLHKATLDAFPYNDVLKYIQYNSFQGDAEKESIVISGTITDPSGRVFMLITKLIEAINNHPSFSGAEMKTFTKNKSSGDDAKGFSTSFTLTLKYYQVKESKEATSPTSQK